MYNRRYEIPDSGRTQWFKNEIQLSWNTVVQYKDIQACTGLRDFRRTESLG